MEQPRVLQFICPRGMYGAERWILALNKYLPSDEVRSEIAVTKEDDRQDPVIRQFEEANQIVHKIHSSSRFNISLIRRLCALIRYEKINIIHTHGYKSDIVGLIAAKRTGIISISTPHGFGEPVDLKHKIYISVGKRFLTFFDHVAPLSGQLKQEVLEAGVAGDRISLIQNGVDVLEVESYRLKERRARNGKKIVGYIGQLIPRKNVDHILNIFNALWLEDDAVELQILGDGESRKSLEKITMSLPCRDSVRFLGFREDRMDYLRQFDLFVMTSSDEGVPRCLMEAIVMGVPVAAYDIPGVDQLIVHEKTGLLAKYDDQEELKSYWNNLLADRQYAQGLAARARELVTARFSGQTMANRYAELYRSLLQQRADG